MKAFFSISSLLVLFLFVNLNKIDAKLCKTAKITNISQFQNLSDCEIIKGSLAIVGLRNLTEENTWNLTLRRLVEVTEYVVLYDISGLKGINHLLPSLKTIGGFKTTIDNSALFVSNLPDLEFAGLNALRNIDNGHIRFKDTPKLCDLAYDIKVSKKTTLKIGCLNDFAFLSEDEHIQLLRNSDSDCLRQCPDKCFKKLNNRLEQVPNSDANKDRVENELSKILKEKPYTQTHPFIDQIIKFEEYLQKDLNTFTSLLSEPVSVKRPTAINEKSLRIDLNPFARLFLEPVRNVKPSSEVINELEKMYQKISLSLEKTQEMLNSTLDKIIQIKMAEHFKFNVNIE